MNSGQRVVVVIVSEGFKWGSDAVEGITGSQSTLATAGRRR